MKKNCWVPDAEDGYAAAEIKETKGDQVTVVTTKGNELSLKKELVQEMNPPKFEKTEDMSNLTFLNDASVLYNLRARYAAMLIYVSDFPPPTIFEQWALDLFRFVLCRHQPLQTSSHLHRFRCPNVYG